MITKLKWLKAFFQRNAVPAAGGDVGKVIYTEKSTSNSHPRKQYVIDLDAGNMDVQIIDAYAGESLEELLAGPNADVQLNDVFPPQTDKSLYLPTDKLAIYTPAQKVTVSLQDGIDGVIDVMNVLDGDTIDGEAVTLVNCTLTELTSDAPLTLNPDGSVDLAALTDPGDYIITYQLAEVADPANTKNGAIQVTVDEV